MNWILVIMVVMGGGKGLTTLPHNFKTLSECQEVGRLWRINDDVSIFDDKSKEGIDANKYFKCLPVKPNHNTEWK